MNSTGQRLRVVYAGTPEFACQPLQALLGAPHFDIIAVYTQPDRRSGRGKKLSPSPVKTCAVDQSVPVLQPNNFTAPADLSALHALQADVMVVAAYGIILPQAVLDAPRLGCLNIHASLLPQWRGAAPVERAIQAGDTETGITIMQMGAGLDTGDILLKKTCRITEQDTGDSLRIKLATLGSSAIIEVLDLAANNELTPEPQKDSLSSYAKKIEKPECEIQWQLTAKELDRTIRAFCSAYTGYTSLKEQRIKVGAAGIVSDPPGSTDKAPGTIVGHSNGAILVKCGSGTLALGQLQMPGARMLAVSDLLNSRAELFAAGQIFGHAAQSN